MSASIYDVVTATLATLGMPEPAHIIQTMLMKDRYFVGHKLGYDGGYAIALAESNSIEFYSDDGRLLTSVARDAEKSAAA